MWKESLMQVLAEGFVVGQTYTWTASTNFGGAGLGIIIDIASTRQHTSGRASDKTFTWTPGDTTTVTGHAICGAGQSNGMFARSTTT